MSETYNYMEEEQGGLMACESSSWGGQWTEEKLDAFEKYVNAYLTIMNVYKERYRWKLIYFDGFAGSSAIRAVLPDLLSADTGSAVPAFSSSFC